MRLIAMSELSRNKVYERTVEAVTWGVEHQVRRGNDVIDYILDARLKIKSQARDEADQFWLP